MTTSILGKTIKYIPLDFYFELSFYTYNAKVYTTRSLTTSHYDSVASNKAESVSNGYIVTEVWVLLDNIDASIEASRYARPTILTLVSIISYLLDCPLKVHESPFTTTIQDAPDEKPSKLEVSRFVSDEVDKSSDLLKILEAIYPEEGKTDQFVVSAMSRWRKARFLEEQSEVVNLYLEESFLAYFHILELLANYYSRQQSNEAENQIKRFLSEFLTNTLKLQNSQLEQATQEKYKVVRSILLSDGQISIASKLCYYLDQVGLLDAKTQYFVGQLIKIRNSLAHGRHVYREEFTWSLLPPFFPISPDTQNYIDEIRIFTANAIGAFLEIDTWSDDWVSIHVGLPPPSDIVKNFLHNKCYESVSPEEFVNGNADGVRPRSIMWQFLSNKIGFQTLEAGLRSLMLNVQVNEDTAFEIFEVAVILADSKDKQLSKSCQNIIATIHHNRLVWYSNIKDVLRELEYHGKKPVWFREWIETGGHGALDKKN